MKETTRNFVIGIVAILGVAGFAFLLLLFGNLTTSLRQKYDVTVHANQAMGVRLGSQVTLVGVPIGEVKAVTVVIDSENPVQIILNIEGSIDIPAGVEATVSTSLIGGTARLDFSIPAGYTTGGATLPHDGNAIVTAKFEGLEERLSRTLSEKLAGLDLAMRRIDELGKDAQKWLGDEQMLADAKSAVAKANDLIDATASTVMALTKTANSLQGNANALLASVQPVFDQLSKTLAQVELLTKQAQDGKGTIGQLMSNPDLYNSLNDSAQRLKSTLGEVELLMQKIRAEGLGVKF
ncbi:MAG: MlaD family protein [Phycisphaerales bacterium]|jgi:phospholipid/cholesterol/gamma-HCH transport system substrate-binding protein